MQTFLDGKVTLHCGDSREVLRSLDDCSIDSVVTDPPYALVSIVKRFGGENAAPANDNDVYSRASAGFMGKQWDTGETAFAIEFWTQVFRVLKPGGHVAAFSGTRSYHRLACAIEDAGFEIRDQLAWLYGSGFPKSHDVSKGIDKAIGGGRAGKTFDRKPGMAESWDTGGGRGFSGTKAVVDEPATPQPAEWQGFGTALKPAWEPICLARKPLSETTIAANVLRYGTGALNIDGCRIGDDEMSVTVSNGVLISENGSMAGGNSGIVAAGTKIGRWPANICHDGSDEVLAAFPAQTSVTGKRGARSQAAEVIGTAWLVNNHTSVEHTDSGSAARFFYSAKADKQDRIGSKHPTVKPVALMQWLCRLITPPGGTILDPFAGSGSTGEAAWREGFTCHLIEREEEYQADIAERLRLADKGPSERKQRAIRQTQDAGPLFGDAANDNGGGADRFTASSRINN